MDQALHFAAAGGLIMCFGAIVVASIRHFSGTRDSRGMMLLRVLNVACTVGYAIWTVRVQSAPGLAIVALCMAGGSFALMRAAIVAVPRGTLDVAFTGNGPDRLIRSGIYGYIRNPLYSAYLVYWAGWAVLTGGHPAALAVTGLFIGLYTAAVLQEERFLTARFAAEYGDYRAQAGRFWPRLIRG